MSRSGYGDYEGDGGNEVNLWRGAVRSAIRGKRGQQLLAELVAGLDAMPEKVLIADDLQADGKYCALGVVGKNRGISLEKLDPTDREAIADAFNIAGALAAEIVYENDEGAWRGNENPEQRWGRMRSWAVACLRNP